MRNTIRFLIALIVAGVFVTLFIKRLDKTESQTQEKMPTVITAGNEFTSLDINQLRGRYVLVNFWDSQNAVSRIATAEYDRWSRLHPAADLALVQVNTDSDKALWNEIVAHDDFDPATQFHLSLTKTKESRDYRPTDGHASYLLSPEGKIIARNPSVESLSRLVPSSSSLALNRK
ncbi:MAG: hypothetical protein K2K55_06025 [Duncaniella sp.]|nr:hypothetical protein [Duncaniella sp.]